MISQPSVLYRLSTAAVLGAAAAAPASGQVFVNSWSGGGTNDLWTNPDNWEPRVPNGPLDAAILNNAIGAVIDSPISLRGEFPGPVPEGVQLSDSQFTTVGAGSLDTITLTVGEGSGAAYLADTVSLVNITTFSNPDGSTGRRSLANLGFNNAGVTTVSGGELAIGVRGFGFQETFNNTGTLRAAGDGVITLVDGPFRNAGVFDALDGGTFQIEEASLPTSSLRDNSSQTFLIRGGTMNLVDRGSSDTDLSASGVRLFLAGTGMTDLFSNSSESVTGGSLDGVSRPGDIRSRSYRFNSGIFDVRDGMSFTTTVVFNRGGEEFDPNSQSPFRNTGILTVADGGRFAAGVAVTTGSGLAPDAPAASWINLDGGRLTGNGTFAAADSPTFTAGAVRNDGTILPGDGFGTVGTLTFDADLVLGSTSRVELDVGDLLVTPPATLRSADLAAAVVAAVPSDRLVVTGDLTLGGTLVLNLRDAAALAGGAELLLFEVGGAVTGSFDSVVDTAGDRLFAVSISPGGVSIGLIPEPSSLLLVAAAGGLLLQRRRA